MSALPLMMNGLTTVNRRRVDDDRVQDDPNAVFCEHCGADLKLNWFGPLPIPARFLECDCGGGVA